MKLTLICFFLFPFLTQAQDDWRLYPDENPSYTVEYYGSTKDSVQKVNRPGEIVFYQDARIDSLLAYLESHPPSIKGYRVEIFFGKRKDAENVKSNFLRKYDEWPIYVIWQQPNFKVQVGNFMTKLQAEKTQQMIKSDFPNAYISITEIKMEE